MPRKLLMLASFIVLILVALFIYMMKNKEHPLAQTQQEVPKESDETFVRRVPTVSSSQPKQVIKNSEPTEEVRSLEELEEKAEGIQPEVASEIGAPETEGGETKMSPELEELFIAVKQSIDQERTIDIEARPFLDEHFKLKQRQIEIGLHDLAKVRGEEAKRLHEEFRKNQEQMQTLMAVIAPFGERKRQLHNEFEQKYGMTLEEFFKKYDADYRTWKGGL